ncbi:unnamed protein product [Clonostachys byssicola]|uniref:Rhodopsin domain-containing protein n=1 Tax=Clonostachys byssicola TaxID=160290 RepID=A0A9N9UJ20_9HYPO|nr:unnamed protein product [Clonostachys byssicola]
MPLSSLVSRAVSGFNGGDPSKYPGAFPPPAGVVANLKNPPDAGRVAGVSTLVVCLAVSTILFAVRFYVKLRITRRFLLEDLIRHGLGHHSWDISVDEYASMLEWLYITSILYEPAAFFTKVTLLLLLARVFAVNTRLARGIYYFILALFIAYIPILGLKIGLCGPPSAFWDPTVPGECLDLRIILVVDVAFAIATDSLIFFIPIPSTWKMRINWRKKIKMILLLGAGGTAAAVTIYRLIKLIKYLESKDVASDFMLLDILTILELTIGLTCSCLPALNILIEHHRHPALSRNSPRTGFRRPIGDEDNPTKRLAWNWLGTTLSIEPKWPPATSSVGSRTMPRRPTKASAHTNFDMELAILSGRHNIPGEPREDGEEAPETPPDSWFTGRRMTACDGRREGWLHSCAHVDQEGAEVDPAATAEDGGSDETGESKRSRDISARLAEFSGNQPWGGIWDGRSNQVGASNHVEPGSRPPLPQSITEKS